MILSMLRYVAGDFIHVADRADGGVTVTRADGTSIVFSTSEWAELGGIVPAFNNAVKPQPQLA